VVGRERAVELHLLVEHLVGDPRQVGHRGHVVGLHARQGEQSGVVQELPVVLFDPVSERGFIERAGHKVTYERVLFVAAQTSLPISRRRSLKAIGGTTRPSGL
jgi:hypothetical protein